ncbi:MAG TPA: sugar phosphate nucleotidyltransferase [Dehalococcoidia bacterium]|nr:sugar phosphate nucleotidyltransferase [Dehalococcoidia bacterium]
MKAVLLAGGRGVRLRPLTYTIPKPLLPVGEKPILEEIIERLKAQGFGEFIIAVGYRAELIETYFRDGAQLGVRIEYVREEQALGTAGPLGLVRARCDLRRDEPLLAMNGDILTALDTRRVLEFHARGGFEMTVATREFRLQHPYGVIRTEGDRITEIVEKPAVTDIVSAGIYAIQPSALDLIPAGRFFDIPDLVNALLAAGRSVGSFRFDDEWLAIDRLDQLEDAGRQLAERHA